MIKGSESMASKQRGRPNKYLTQVQPRLKDIEKMALTMTEKQIAKAIGVGYSSWCDYKLKYPELSDALKKGRQELVVELRSTMIRKAKGFNYEEKKVIKENGKIVREEIYTRASMPDVAALNLLLKNYDKENWSNDPQAMEIRKKELELQERKLEESSW